MTTPMPETAKTVEPDIFDHAYVPPEQWDTPHNLTTPCHAPECGLARWRHAHDAGTEALWLDAEENALEVISAERTASRVDASANMPEVGEFREGKGS